MYVRDRGERRGCKGMPICVYVGEGGPGCVFVYVCVGGRVKGEDVYLCVGGGCVNACLSISFLCLSVILSVRLSPCLSMCLLLYLPVCLYVCVSFFQFVFLWVSSGFVLSVCLSHMWFSLFPIYASPSLLTVCRGFRHSHQPFLISPQKQNKKQRCKKFRARRVVKVA